MMMMIRSFFLKLCLLEFQKPTVMAELSVPESSNDRLLSRIFYLHPLSPFHCLSRPCWLWEEGPRGSEPSQVHTVWRLLGTRRRNIRALCQAWRVRFSAELSSTFSMSSFPSASSERLLILPSSRVCIDCSSVLPRLMHTRCRQLEY